MKLVVNQLYEARLILAEQLEDNQEALTEGVESLVTLWGSVKTALSASVVEAAKFAAIIDNLNRTNLQGSLEYSGRGGDPRDFMGGPTYTSQMGYKSAADIIAEANRGTSGGSSSGGRGGIVDQAAQTRQVLDNLLSDLNVQQAIEDMERAQRASEKLGKTMKDSLGGALKSVVEGTKSASEAFKDMARQILKQAYDLLVVQPLMNTLFGSSGAGGGFGGFLKGMFAANGAAFNSAGVQMFADGGVVNSPTGFRHAGGLGVMGEAGPEAIMPLKRGKNGQLGVQMEGGSQPIVINQSFNFSANGDESVKRIIAQEAPKIANLTQRQILDQRRRGGAFKQTFG